MKLSICSVLLVFAVSFSCSNVRATDKQLDATSTERLVSLCKVWGTVRYLHPYLAYKDIDWDAALVAALPKVEAARDDNGFRAAVQAMLDRLGDPSTRVARTASQPPMGQGVSSAKDEKDRPLFSWVENDFLAIHLERPPSVSKLMDPKTKEALLAAVNKASGVILDLRVENDYWSSVVLRWLSPLLRPWGLRPLPASCW